MNSETVRKRSVEELCKIVELHKEQAKERKVVIIEDDINLNRMLQFTLGKAGYLTTGFLSAGELFDTWKANESAIMILDYNLPDMTADRLIEMLEETGEEIQPFVVITGDGDERVAVRMMKLGARDYVLKESNFIQKLLDAVNDVKADLEQKEEAAAKALATKAYEKQYCDMLEKANIPVYLRKDEKLLLFNEEARKLFHTDQNWIEGSQPGVLEIVSDESRKEFEERLDRCKKGKTFSPYTKFIGRSFSGEDITIELTEAAIIMGGERIIQGTMRNATRQDQLENQMHQATKMEAIGRLAGGVAHDFNNLLTAISGQAHIARMKLKMNKPVLHEIEEIENVALKAAKLTGQLLAFSRVQESEPKTLDLNDVIKDAGKMLRPIIGEDVSLKMDLCDDSMLVDADDGQLIQLIMNLVVNARDAMPDGGTLHFETGWETVSGDMDFLASTLKEGKYVAMSVSDTGCGMSRETLSHLFEPFFTTKEKGKGTGMGLATVYGIVKKYEGDIHVYSELNQGTVFRVFLPASESTLDTDVKDKPAVEVKGGVEQILIVEDDPQVRNLSAKLLGMKGYQVLQAESAEEALKILKETDTSIDLMITDVIMKDMNGLELGEKVLEMNEDQKILYISGYTDRMMLELDKLNKENQFLQKPFSPTELSLRVRQLLDTD